MAAELTAVLRASNTAKKMASHRERAANTSTLKSKMAIAPMVRRNGMEMINRKEALRKKGASGMGLNMVDSEDDTARHMLTRIAAAVHKAWLGD
ncbi:MAG TPA: hypothetical protein VF019_05745 [Nitrospira sp.]